MRVSGTLEKRETSRPSALRATAWHWPLHRGERGAETETRAFIQSRPSPNVTLRLGWWPGSEELEDPSGSKFAGSGFADGHRLGS